MAARKHRRVRHVARKTVHPSQSPIIQLAIVFIVVFALLMMLYVGKNVLP